MPKSVWNENKYRIEKYVGKLRCDLENRMFKDNPFNASTVFYSVSEDLFKQFIDADSKNNFLHPIDKKENKHE